MSDIFISYKREDRPRAREIANKFKEHGFSVWWDRKIPPGKTFDQVIQEALDRASCVIVLWSETSVKSDWVKEEAEKGASRGILVPVLIDEVPIPLGFGRIQTANLVGWQGDVSDPAFVQLTRTIEVMLGHRVETSGIYQDLLAQATVTRIPPAGPKPDAGSRRRPRGWMRAALWAAAVLLSAITGAGVYSYVSQAAAANEQAGATAPTPPPVEAGDGAEPLPAADTGTAVTEIETGERVVDAAQEISAEPAAAATPIAADPAAEAYRQLTELQQRAMDATLNDAELLAGYEELWSQHRQWLGADAAAGVVGTIASLKASQQAFETLEAAHQRGEVTILDQLSQWREFAQAYPGSAARRQAAKRIEELEQIVRSSATITAEDRFVTCERVIVAKNNSRPIGVRKNFRPGLVYVFARVNAPRTKERLKVQWLNDAGTVTHTNSVTVSSNTAGGYRIHYAKQHVDPGRYEVRLFNESGQLIGRRTFTVGTSR